MGKTEYGSFSVRALGGVLILALLASCQAASPTPTPHATSVPTEASAPIRTPEPSGIPTQPATREADQQPPAETPVPGDPFLLISEDSLMSYTEALSSIQAYSGWRNSASLGEAEALDYLVDTLQSHSFLSGLGLELERQSFRVFTGTEFWEEQIVLTIGVREVEVPAEAIRGSRDVLEAALRFDSDGQPNDADRNPVQVSAAVTLISSEAELNELDPQSAAGQVLLVDHALIDRALQDAQIAGRRAQALLNLRPAGIVIVTQFSNEPGVSHGTYLGDSPVFSSMDPALPKMPILFFRIEDLRDAGITGWDDLASVQSAELTWDADVFSPAESGNLIARIPGADQSRAVLLGAHIDSPNSPGALDDGSGSVTLLEVARALNEAGLQPPVDVYLLWFGSEELGLWGSGYFAASHPELLDRTIGMLQVDDLTYPIEGIDATINLSSWPYSSLDPSARGLPWAEHLVERAASRGIRIQAAPMTAKVSDNSNLDGFDVPNAQMDYGNHGQMSAQGGFWFAGHIHGPYDTPELVRQVLDPLKDFVRIALSAALELPPEDKDLRFPPDPEQRAVVVASHTEAPHMTPAEMKNFGMVLALQGYDVDVVPYGQAVAAQDLEGASLVIALPVFDLPSAGSQPVPYDEAWSAEEAETLQAYARGGGLLIITSSARRVKHGLSAWETNEDMTDANAISQEFGITFLEETLSGSQQLRSVSDHALMAGITSLRSAADNAVALQVEAGEVLAASADGKPAAALVATGDQGGEVLALGDVSLFSTDFSGPGNIGFWRNLAEHARAR